MSRAKSSRSIILNPTVLLLGLVSFFADVASEMLYPITPIFLTGVLGASMASVGFIEGCAEGLASFLKLGVGAWSDRSGKRKPFVVAGYFFAALAKPLTAFSTSWVHVLFVRGLDRTGKGLRSAPRDAMLAESVPESARGAAFGWHRAFDSAGAALGPLLALYFLQSHSENLREIFLWALIPGLIAAVLVFFVPERAVTPRSTKVKVLPWNELSPSFKKYLFVWGIFSLVNSSDVFLLMKAKSIGFSLSEVVLLYCLYNCIYAGLSPWLGGLSDRIDRKLLLVFGLAAFCLVYLGFAFAQAGWQFYGLFAAYGIYMAATDGAGKAFAIDLMPKDRKASAIGALGAVSGICTIIASTAAGFSWDHLGPAAPFYLGATGAGLAALLFWLVDFPVQSARSPSSK